MKAEKVIKARLDSVTAVTDIVGTRIRGGILKQNETMPAVVYSRTGSRRTRGVSSDPGMATVTLRLTCVAQEYDDVKALAEAVRVALQRYGSAEAGADIGGVTVYDILFVEDADEYDNELGLHLVPMIFEVIHAE